MFSEEIKNWVKQPLILSTINYVSMTYDLTHDSQYDVVIGAVALVAEHNGAEKESAVKDKLIEMPHPNEILYCCGIACSAKSHPTESVSYIIDLLPANVCKQNVTRFSYEIVRLV